MVFSSELINLKITIYSLKRYFNSSLENDIFETAKRGYTIKS